MSWPGRRCLRDFGKNVFGRRELESHRSGALELLIGNIHRTIIGNGCGLDDQGGLGHAFEHGLAHLVGGGHLDQFAMRRRMQRGRAADQNDFGSAALRGIGKGITHLAAGTVANVANRIESFARAARGDQHDFAGQIVAAAHAN